MVSGPQAFGRGVSHSENHLERRRINVTYLSTRIALNDFQRGGESARIRVFTANQDKPTHVTHGMLVQRSTDCISLAESHAQVFSGTVVGTRGRWKSQSELHSRMGEFFQSVSGIKLSTAIAYGQKYLTLLAEVSWTPVGTPIRGVQTVRMRTALC